MDHLGFQTDMTQDTFVINLVFLMYQLSCYVQYWFSLDDGGRYAYDQQPSICKWNLEKLAEALSPSLSKEDAKKGLEMYCKYNINLFVLVSLY